MAIMWIFRNKCDEHAKRKRRCRIGNQLPVRPSRVDPRSFVRTVTFMYHRCAQYQTDVVKSADVGPIPKLKKPELTVKRTAETDQGVEIH